MNATIIMEAMVLAVMLGTFLTPIMFAQADAMGPSGKCYIDCTGGGMPSSPGEHNMCLSACVFGEGVQRLDDGVLTSKPLPSDRPKGQHADQK